MRPLGPLAPAHALGIGVGIGFGGDGKVSRVALPVVPQDGQGHLGGGRVKGVGVCVEMEGTKVALVVCGVLAGAAGLGCKHRVTEGRKEEERGAANFGFRGRPASSSPAIWNGRETMR